MRAFCLRAFWTHLGRGNLHNRGFCYLLVDRAKTGTRVGFNAVAREAGMWRESLCSDWRGDSLPILVSLAVGASPNYTLKPRGITA